MHARDTFVAPFTPAFNNSVPRICDSPSSIAIRRSWGAISGNK
jgi:hypothetical protein